MSKSKIVLLAAALAIPLAGAAPAFAATAHNEQTGASTTNNNEPGMKKPMPMKMKKKHMKKM